MDKDIIETYKELLQMVETLRIRISLGASKDQKVVYDHSFLVIKDLLNSMIIKEYENRSL